MISHVVLMKPRVDLSDLDRTAFVDAFERAVRDIPTVRDVSVARRLRHGAGYEQTAPDVAFVATISFDDLAGLQTYLGHPAHQELGERFGRAMQLAMVYDCEVGELGDLRRWQSLP
jgi:hypothetical protein